MSERSSPGVAFVKTVFPAASCTASATGTLACARAEDKGRDAARVADVDGDPERDALSPLIGEGRPTDRKQAVANAFLRENDGLAHQENPHLVAGPRKSIAVPERHGRYMDKTPRFLGWVEWGEARIG